MTTITRRNRPTLITDAPEHRNIPIERVEMRADSENENEIILEGYASTFEEYEMYGGPERYGWIERIDPKAFEVTLREKPDLHLLINHAGMPLARTKSGNLDLTTDGTGLKVTARLDTRDPEVQSLAVKMERGDMDEMSFAFRVKAQEWRAAPGYEEIDDQSYRTITEVSLHKGDVSVVNWGANPTTSVGLRSLPDAVKMLADANVAELAEIRSDDSETLLRAVENLGKLVKPAGPTVTITNMNVRSDAATKENEVTDEVQAGTADDVEVEPTEERSPVEILVEAVQKLTERLDALEGNKAEATVETDEEEAERSEEVTEEVTDEPVVEEVRTSKLDEALAAQGILPEKLSLAAALAFED